MRTVKYASQYQLTFSLLNGDPGDVALDWDVRPAVEDFIFPFLNAVSNLSDFAVSSQIQHYASLPIQPEQVQNDGKEYFALRPHALPHFINSAEWNLASVVSSAPPINFILFVPPFSQSPLRLLKSNGEFLKTNAFLIPQWGGILVRDPPQDKGSAYRLSRSELHPIMEIFVSQLRSLLGVKEIVIPNVKDLLPDVRVEYDPAPHVGLTKWELDRLTRERAVQNLVDAVTTLNSLATLIFDLENMVVLDHIQTEVLAALDAVDKGYKALEDSSFEEAARYARLAITSAESAFFDPTMVSMLYFPDEHKYAVYMPLFVPVAVPLLIASIKELKAWKQGRRGHKAKYE
ncbi:hypothetical protein HK104_000793 [Borealophlyctis nickersoniae]|nr:hypothetical protein HK104_000793 [Borealophlyctis nickersoniae]